MQPESQQPEGLHLSPVRRLLTEARLRRAAGNDSQSPQGDAASETESPLELQAKIHAAVLAGARRPGQNPPSHSARVSNIHDVQTVRSNRKAGKANVAAVLATAVALGAVSAACSPKTKTKTTESTSPKIQPTLTTTGTPDVSGGTPTTVRGQNLQNLVIGDVEIKYVPENAAVAPLAQPTPPTVDSNGDLAFKTPQFAVAGKYKVQVKTTKDGAFSEVGTLDVINTKGAGPTLLGLSKNTGKAGDLITVKGNFNESNKDHITIKFGNEKAEIVSLNSNDPKVSATEAAVKAPTGVPLQTVAVTAEVKDRPGVSTLSSAFTYDAVTVTTTLPAPESVLSAEFEGGAAGLVRVFLAKAIGADFVSVEPTSKIVFEPSGQANTFATNVNGIGGVTSSSRVPVSGIPPPGTTGVHLVINYKDAAGNIKPAKTETVPYSATAGVTTGSIAATK